LTITGIYYDVEPEPYSFGNIYRLLSTLTLVLKTFQKHIQCHRIPS